MGRRTIYSTIIGDYARAHFIFKSDLSSCKNVPVVAIERAELALQQGRYKEIWETLDEALSNYSLEESNTQGASYHAMSMFRALAAIRYKGSLEPAKEDGRGYSVKQRRRSFLSPAQ